MGLSSVWTAIVGSRVKEITPQRPFSFETNEDLASPHSNQNRNAAISEVTFPPGSQDVELSRGRRKSRPSQPKQKSEERSKNRKSWFPGEPSVQVASTVPQLPPLSALPRLPAQRANPVEQVTRPGTALTTNEDISWSRPGTPEALRIDKRKSKRLSLGQALKGRMRSKSSASQAKSDTDRPDKRQSVLGGHREMAPPVPALPSPNPELINHDTGMVPSLEVQRERRRSRRLSMASVSRAFSRERSKSTASHKRRRSAWWQSSNPDDDGTKPPPMPPLPGLEHDDRTTSPDSSVAMTATPDNSDFISHTISADHPMKTVTRGTIIKQPRPVSGVSLSSRKSYTPKNAASGFLRSTSGRASLRHSLMDDGEGGTICLSDEQQREWDKLKALMDAMDRQHEKSIVGVVRQVEQDEDREDRSLFSNAQALAALEFGTAR